MVGTLWVPGAERITPSAPGGVITSTAPPRVVWHTTEADPGSNAVWAAMIRVLKGKNAEPQILWDPVTDRLGQFIPLDRSGRALKNDGGSQTNRTGRVCIQIEVIARSAKPFTEYWKPGQNFRALMAAIRSWGIQDVWPSGPPPRFIASPPHNVPEDERSRTVWQGKGGHYGHSQIPGNDHGDPGGIDVKKLFAAGGTASPAPPKEDDMSAADVAAIIKQINAVSGHLQLNAAQNRQKLFKDLSEAFTLAQSGQTEQLTTFLRQQDAQNDQAVAEQQAKLDALLKEDEV